MSSSDNDLNVPNLGPAQRDPELVNGAAAAPPQAAAAVEQPAMAPQPKVPVAPAAAPVAAAAGGRGLGVFTGGLLVLVLAACGGLGYWLMELQLQFQTRSAELTEARYQIGELRELLQVAESSSLQSGRGLISEVGQLSTTAQSKYTHYDSEIAKLWTIAYQRNKPQLEAQQKALAGQAAQLKSQAEKQTAQEGQLTNLLALVEAQKTLLDEQAVALQAQSSQLGTAQKELKSMAAQSENVEKAVKFVTALKISQDKLSSSQSSTVKATDTAVATVRRELANTRTELGTQAEILNEQLAEQADTLKALQSRVGKGNSSNTAASPALKRRIAHNEDAIRAFDGTRRQLNRELLQIRQKLNNLQLKVESR